FAAFMALASFGIGNMSQANSIAETMNGAFGIPFATSGALVAAGAALVIFGGLKRIAGVAEKLVPFASVLYIAGGIYVMAYNHEQLPAAFSMIFSEAFRPEPALSGAAGYGIATAMRYGISRGVFSNEAGLGSTVMAHSASDVKEPVEQGMWGIFEVFADTIVVCTITALCILSSGVWSPGGSLTGAALTSAAFETALGGFAGGFISISIMLFAFSTIIGWSYYGERSMRYIAGRRAAGVYKAVFVAFVFIGSVLKLEMVWDISDTFNGLMALPNLAALALLFPQVKKLTEEYIRKGKGRI
ncbi:MAG: alanine/glycine:cation symporter family protein, partial [Christensenellales bacterium]